MSMPNHDFQNAEWCNDGKCRYSREGVEHKHLFSKDKADYTADGFTRVLRLQGVELRDNIYQPLQH